MALVHIEDLTIGFRGPPLLEDVSCRIEAGQRIGLLGRNGAGKTTFMRILEGAVEPDSGQLTFAPQTRVALLPQDVPRDIQGLVRQVVAQGGQEIAGAGAEDPESAWKHEHQVEQILSRMELDGNVRFKSLSSGMKRRVLLARSLVSQPELLLLDEPTNHLDIQAIEWLEGFLLRWTGTLLFVTHDRMFLRNLATRILEIEGGQLFDWSCDYDTFLQRKEAAIAAQQKQHALFDKKLAQEETWIRQGIKARRTRNEGRVRALEKMRAERRTRREGAGAVRLEIDEGQRSGQLVAEARDIQFSYGDQPVVSGFSTTIMRGDKIGMIGPNGAGKTTLLKLLLGELNPDSGNVRLGANLQIAYFDQLREQLDHDRTVQHNVGDGYESISLGGRKKHIIGYLQDFLFTPERARTQVRFLSGGERNRVLLARLFAKPANVIVLDEPTNDLDQETLELLEERLIEYTGTVLLVSHDRAFLNNVVTSTIVFEENGVREYVGGYDDWLRQRESAAAPQKEASRSSGAGASTSRRGPASAPLANVSTAKDSARDAESRGGKRRKLSYHEQHELDRLPEEIERLEAAIDKVHQALADPDFYKQPGDTIVTETERLKELEDALAQTYHRWEELEERSHG